MARETQPFGFELSRLHWGEWLDTDEEMVRVKSCTSLLAAKVESGVVLLDHVSGEEGVSIVLI